MSSQLLADRPAAEGLREGIGFDLLAEPAGDLGLVQRTRIAEAHDLGIAEHHGHSRSIPVDEGPNGTAGG